MNPLEELYQYLLRGKIMKDDYFSLLDEYHRMIDSEPWWDGRREELVVRMDKSWKSLPIGAQQMAFQYAKKLYERRIG